MKFAVVSGFLIFISEALKILNAPPLSHSWNVFSRLEGVMLIILVCLVDVLVEISVVTSVSKSKYVFVCSKQSYHFRVH